jgi:Family of unknown function (DUF5335)
VYFDALSKELMNVPVSIEIVDASGPPAIEASHLDLRVLSYDGRDDVFEVAVARRSRHLPLLHHLVDKPERVTVDSWTMLASLTITVSRRDGVRTLIRIEGDPIIGVLPPSRRRSCVLRWLEHGSRRDRGSAPLIDVENPQSPSARAGLRERPPALASTYAANHEEMKHA